MSFLYWSEHSTDDNLLGQLLFMLELQDAEHLQLKRKQLLYHSSFEAFNHCTIHPFQPLYHSSSQEINSIS